MSAPCLKLGLITLLVLVFCQTREIGPALLKSDKTGPSLIIFLHFWSYPHFFLQKRRCGRFLTDVAKKNLCGTACVDYINFKIEESNYIIMEILFNIFIKKKQIKT